MSESETINLQLGDIIQIESSEPSLNNQIFVIKYLDLKQIKIINISNLENVTLTIDENGDLAEPISQISLLSRDPEVGYARQHGLLPGKWINIYFGGDLPTTITGNITNIEEDMIEIKTFPGDDIIYIDFGFKGIPQDLPIENIELREPPELSKPDEASIRTDVIQSSEEQLLDDVGSPAPDPLSIPEEDIKSQIQELFITADEIQFGPELDSISQVIQVDKEKQRFGIDNQTNDLLDELLASIPNSKRSKSVLNNLHIIIERFKQLRSQFSKFDEFGNALLPTTKTAQYKPLVHSLQKLNTKLYWLLPIASNKKNLYDIDQDEAEEFNDINSLTLAQSQIKLTDAINNYYDDTIPDEENKYHYLIKIINEETNPFTKPSSVLELSEGEDSGNIITNLNVGTNLNVVIDNLENLYSSVAFNDSIKRKRFLITKYNLGLKGLKPTELTGSKMVSVPIKLTPNDDLYLKSMLMLPESFIRYSHISLPATDILTKVNLNTIPFYYFDKLQKKTFVNSLTVDKESETESFDESLLSNITELIPNLSSTSNNYEEYLNSIIPKTKTVFKLMEKYITGSLSLHDVVSKLEPFLIYTDDLTFQQYSLMTRFIFQKILDYKKEFVSKQREFRKLISGKSSPRYVNYLIYSLLHGKINPTDQSSIQETILSSYNLNEQATKFLFTSSEILNKMYIDDYANLYMNGVALSNLSLITSVDINEEFEQGKAQLEVVTNKEKTENQCKNYVLAKKYIAIDELQDDNMKDIYFDKKLDPTRYDIYNEILENSDIKDKIPEEQTRLLKEHLIKNIGLTEEDAVLDAFAMINGKRPVKEGEYALLIDDVSEPNTKYLYYTRKDNVWQRDESIPSGDFSNEKLFCNLQQKCFDINEKCSDVNLSESQLKKSSLNKVIKEFDIKYEVSKQELEKILSNKINHNTYLVNQLNIINKNLRLKNNNFKLSLVTDIEPESVIVSPYSSLRDIILGQNDFVSKQSNIVKLCTRYTRASSESEDPFWRYCLETNTKLMPTFLLTLAKTFLEKRNYQTELDNICSKQGKISDDGEAWVDEHSGYVIKKIEFSSEEGYDESGYKIQSREKLQADLADVSFAADDSEDIMLDPNAQIVNNVISALTSYMGINIEEKRHWIIRNSLLTNVQTIPSKEVYDKKAAALLKSKNKKLPSYEDTFNNSLLLFTLAYFHIAIQTSIPNIKTRKRFPGCVKSFDGFPLNGSSSFDGLTYVICVANKIKSTVKPWNTIKKNSETTLVKRVKDIITKYVLNNEEVVNCIKKKLEWNLLNQGDEVPIELDILKWNTFLPPLLPVKLKSIENVSSSFKETLLSDIKSGKKSQNEKIQILTSKVMYFSLKIQENIQSVLDKEKPLLTNSANEPFLENVCCHETFSKTVDYFINKDKNIKINNDTVFELSNILFDLKNIVQAVRIFDPRSTRIVYPTLADDFSETTIYRCFIKYCRFASMLPVPELVAPLCLTKPDNFNPYDSIEEQIRILKRDGKIFTGESLNSLLKIINFKHIIKSNFYPTVPDNIQRIRDILIYLQESSDTIIDGEFKVKLQALIDTYDVATTETTPAMRDVKNYLSTKNTELKAEIISFLHENLSISKKKIKPVEEFINTFTLWEDVSQESSPEIKEQSVYRILNFIKDCIYNMTRVFPNIILNKVNYKVINIPRHWKLSDRHINDVKKIISSYYLGLIKYYDKESIEGLLNNINIYTKNMLILLENIPCFTSVTKDKVKYTSIFNDDISKLIFEFIMLECYMSYIKLCDSMDLALKPKSKEEETMITNVQLEDIETGNITELEIVQGEKLLVKQEISGLLFDITQIFISTKKTLNFSFDSVMKRVNRAKEKEKDDVTTRLKELTDEEREIDTLFKNHKLGTWSKGLQKGLTQYVKETYDEERLTIENRTINEAKVGELSFVTEMNNDIYLMDMEQEQHSDQAIAREVNDISMFVGEEDDHEDRDGDEYY